MQYHTMIKKIWGYLALLLFITGATEVHAQKPKNKPGDQQQVQVPTDRIPMDPNIRTGKLPNGLIYYIRKNNKPENRVELRLALNAGSILESDDQQGLAHLLEHMAFNGTKKYKKQDLVNFLESIGVNFGADLNAYTSFDETVYMLKVPTDKPGLVDKGVDVLREWAGNISLDPTEVDKERGVVIEEWRLGLGAQERIRDKQFPVLLKNSQYAKRLPIGKPEIIENFKHDRLVQFYKDWYRPDLMAVVVVGDVDPVKMEKDIRRLFGTLKNPSKKASRKYFDVPNHPETLVSIVSDPEAEFRQIGIIFKHPATNPNSRLAYREGLISQLWSSMLSTRLQEIATKPNPPFAFAGGGYGSFVRTKDAFQLSAIVPEGKMSNALEVLLTEAERIRRHGFLPSEFEREKANLLRSYENNFNEKDKTESNAFANEYVRHFLENEPAPGISWEYEYVKQALPAIKLEEVNQFAVRYMTDQNRVLNVTGKEDENNPLPTESELFSVLNKMKGKDITPYTDSAATSELLPQLPISGAITKAETEASTGITRLTLSNGAMVTLKPTNFKNDEVLFSATSPGGTSLVSDADYASVELGNQVMAMAGIGNFSMIELQKKLSGKVARVGSYIGDRSEGLTGMASPKDLETLFQLIHLRFTQPRLDEASLNMFKSQFQMFKGFFAAPDYVFQDTISVTMSRYHPRVRPFSSFKVEELNADRALAIYRERFGNAGDFSFYFVGNFEVEKIKPMIARYLASLPTTTTTEEAKDMGIRPPTGVIEKKVLKGKEPKSSSEIQFTGPFEWSRNNRVHLSALGKAIEIRLREELREALSGSYYANASGIAVLEPVPLYTFSVSYASDPARADELYSAMWRVIEEVQTKGVSDEILTKVKEGYYRDLETNLKENRFWMSQIMRKDELKEDLGTILTGSKDLYQSMTSADIQTAARRYLKKDNVARFVLLPENQ